MDLAERIFRRKGYYLTSPYGKRYHPTLKVWKMHNGVDLGTNKEKWSQFALENGIVISAGKDLAGNGALFAWIEYQRIGYRLLHYHLDKVYVRKGQKVTEDTVIGLTGTTGNSTGIHLHLGVKKKINGVWVYIDPESINYTPEGITVNGLLDSPTIKELQMRCGTTIDGVISEPSELIKAIQRKLISGEAI